MSSVVTVGDLNTKIKRSPVDQLYSTRHLVAVNNEHGANLTACSPESLRWLDKTLLTLYSWESGKVACKASTEEKWRARVLARAPLKNCAPFSSGGKMHTVSKNILKRVTINSRYDWQTCHYCKCWFFNFDERWETGGNLTPSSLHPPTPHPIMVSIISNYHWKGFLFSFPFCFCCSCCSCWRT